MTLQTLLAGFNSILCSLAGENRGTLVVMNVINLHSRQLLFDHLLSDDTQAFSGLDDNMRHHLLTTWNTVDLLRGSRLQFGSRLRETSILMVFVTFDLVIGRGGFANLPQLVGDVQLVVDVIEQTFILEFIRTVTESRNLVRTIRLR